MAKIFRKIRQQLISEKKVPKYLAYAIGEIVLVVIGILIALAINNSSENSALKKKEQIYLKGLKSEFETSKLKLNVLIRENKQNYNGAKQLLTYIGNPDEQPTEKQFSELIFSTFSSDINFNPNNSFLNEMINSGSLKDISNKELRLELTNWLSTLEGIYKQESELEIQREEALDVFRTNENSLRTVLSHTSIYEELAIPKATNTFSNLKLLNSVEFENKLLMFILTNHATEEAHYIPLQQKLDVIIKLIEAEIK
ncbi:MAG: DUF6090 family protein [Bacteroidota bacterium]